MQTLLGLLAFIISLATGWLIISILFSAKNRIPTLMHACLGYGLGLAINGEATFISFLLFGHLNRYFVISANAALLAVLAGLWIWLNKKRREVRSLPNEKSGLNKKGFREFAFLALMLIPLCIQAQHYPDGGWDAWSVWNLKAKFLFLAGENWQDIFSPILWRSSPHYPLLLPLINVWGWCFLSEPAGTIPLITAITFTAITAGLLFSMLKSCTKPAFAYLAIAAIMTNPLFLKLTSSQYSDIVFSYYLLATISCLIMAKKTGLTAFSLMAGIFTGALSFTKPEGLVSAGIVIIIYLPYLLFRPQANKKVQTNDVSIPSTPAKQATFAFISGLIITSIIPAIFYFVYAPENITFANEITSQPLLETLMRIRAIFYSYFLELININRWGGLWLILLTTLLLNQKKASDARIIIIPIYIMIYIGITSLYYLINTYFEINWWLKVTLDRILFAILPTIILWVFYSAGEKQEGFNS